MTRTELKKSVGIMELAKVTKTTKARTIMALLFVSVFLLISVFSVTAATHLNISMSEIVYENITFAENFELVENHVSCVILGNLSVTNPHNETVFDIYIKFTNVDKMASDFVWVSGRNGTQYSGGAGVKREYGEVGNTANNVTIQDLDNDNEADYMWVNSTHIIFNLSSESGIIAIRLHNSTNNVSIANAGTTPVPIDMLENITGSRFYGNITINGTANQDNKLNASMTVYINEVVVAPIVIYIPELRQNNYTLFNYNLSCNESNPPLNIETNYSNTEHGFNKKVLAGRNWTVIQTVVNDNPAQKNITNINISIQAQNVTWNDSEFSFSLEFLNPIGDYANVHGNGTSTTDWWWQAGSGTLDYNETKNISYIVRAPYSVPFTATYLAIKEVLSYEVDYLMSNLTIDEINASAKILPDFEKRISQPADNENNHNVTWEIRPSITVPVNITYDLKKVTLWVTQNMNPANKTNGTSWGLLEINYTGNPLARINMTTSWGNSTFYWYFNYTDGSNSSYPPPIVWMKPYWVITNAYGQILNYSRTVNGNDIYLKYIYVINGYWLEIKKNITNIGEDRYLVNISVENIGNGWTPEYEYVTVYDYVPHSFTAYNWTTAPNLNSSVGSQGEQYYGTAYVWQIPWKGTMNSSLGPKYGPDAVSVANYSWNVQYRVNGTGIYQVTDLYIVGLDPLKVDGALASPLISIITELQSHTNEILYISIVGFLIVLNAFSLIMKIKTNKKLKNLPPPPKF